MSSKALFSVCILLAALCLIAGGCRQFDAPAATNLISRETLQGKGETNGRRCDRSAAAGSSPSAQAVAVYRVPVDDEASSRALPEQPPSPVDCTIQQPRDPDQFLLPDAGDPTSLSDDLATRFASPPGEDAEAATRQSSNGGSNDGDAHNRFRDMLSSTCDDVWHDYGNFYSRKTAVQFVAILAPAAVFANTNLDANFGNWYQTHVRSSATDRASSFFRPLGDGFYTIPVYVSAKFIGEYFDDQPGMALLGQFGDRATRALAVGAPPLLVVQYLTGGGRPSAYADQSYWKPFHSSHGASGHAFMGAVPFLTLAGMTDDPFAKCFFYACSPWTGMTRINDNVHYLSQVWLGWWMAYLACESVNRTESQKGPVTIMPLMTPEMSGVGLVYEH